MISCYCVFHCTLGLVCFPILLFATLFGRLLCLPPIYRVSHIFLLSGENFYALHWAFVCLSIRRTNFQKRMDSLYCTFVSTSPNPIHYPFAGFLMDFSSLPFTGCLFVCPFAGHVSPKRVYSLNCVTVSFI